MSLRLVVVEGSTTGAQLLLRDHEIVEVGRDGTDLELEDAAVAPVQLKVHVRGQSCEVTDVAGAGFLHNGRRVHKAQVGVGDAVEVAGQVIRLISDDSQEMPIIEDAPPPRQQGDVLLAVKGNDAGKTYPLDKDVLIIGRGVSTDITVWDIRSSRVHCRIDRTAKGYRLSDLNSSNGTWVNGKRVDTHQLREGDEIKIGATTLQYAVGV